MKKIMAITSLVLLSSVCYADKKYYYFSKTVDGVFIHTYVLRCETPQTTDAIFNSDDMAGPYGDAREADSNLQQAISMVKQQGGKVQLSLGRCLEQQ